MYVPFARKYRPRKFSEVVGQEVAVRILRNAVKFNKLSHAYLFAGPRGTGKTTLARILTKALNCLKPEEGEPCGVCENCTAIDRGSFPDLIEIDAASNRGIDDVRAIRDAVSYAPIKGKYKVYILDEAHMLTKEAFNALLKTLEEPPQKTIFLLCTTEYEKIMPTILSRCQRLVFSKLSEAQIVENLKRICDREELQCEEKALYLIAKLSDGGMRDAVSLLDQAGTYGEGKVSTTLLEEFLGIVSQERVREFLVLLLNSDVDGALGFLKDLSLRGYNLVRFCDLLEEEIRGLLLYKSLKEPERVMQVEDFHTKLGDVPLNALLYLEKVVNTVRLDARSRDFLRAFELAIIKTQIVKDIVPISELLKYGVQPSEGEKKPQGKKEEHQEDPIKLLEGRLDTLTLEVLKRSRCERKEGGFLFYIKEGDLTSEEMNKIRALERRIDFVVELKKEEGGALPPFAEKVKDMFGAKVISHEQRSKGKGPSGKGA
ncbi:MAG: DNA polymerase III subunit gamma/tau [Aquificaceae bacterium]|nr:DNA polymerase III subunit gamma/tau [Aquificaceae bacterium]MCS7195672.1 DNA polymerase III subunit gamma/tau [Aquificaceae bacterium]MDW8295044.1 DNA polymerase III subunit gamma/tau [Aquificaceae bacterium]